MDVYKLMKLLSDPTRMKILFVIHNKPSYVQEIVDITQQSQANVSKHLKKLRELEIVVTETEGNKVKYSMNSCYLNQCIVFVPLMNTYRNHPDGIDLLERINN
ncbi:metalloregulator ArsR/SmtB family transcription factor [Mollicutes bacterium LVI A0039]|nr:metalloregulator ArsR/SmtB family transcription factor [Mollicutes bacterium LVI A0039]